MEALYRVMWAAEREEQVGARYFFNNRTRGGSAKIYCIQRTRAGRVFFEWEGRRQMVPVHHAMLFNHDEDSSYGYPPEDTKPYMSDFLNLAGPDISELLLSVRARYQGVVPMPEGAEGTRLFKECVDRFLHRGFHDRFHESGMVYELLMALQSEAQEANQTRDPILAAHEMILSRFGTPITVGDLAAFCNLSYAHLSRAYTARYRHNPGETLRTLRLRRACELLRNTRAAVWQVSERCGYRDVDSFARAFAREVGCKPLAYRQGTR